VNSDESPFYKYKTGYEYQYDYKTSTKLWINDASNEAKSEVEIRLSVNIQQVSTCQLAMRLSNVEILSDSIDTSRLLESANHLTDHTTLFMIDSNGRLDDTIYFINGDKESVWSRNIKRGIISSFQTVNSHGTHGSSVGYETDILGKCRTSYSGLSKVKHLHDCTLNNNKLTSSLQSIPYKVNAVIQLILSLNYISNHFLILLFFLELKSKRNLKMLVYSMNYLNVIHL
jgi:hypothetical protein